MNNTKPHVALFGGSFNPIHKGHVTIVQKLLKTEVEQVIVLPTSCSPFKSKDSLIPQKIRLEMVNSVFSQWERVYVSDLEMRTHKVSYTDDSLNQLQLEFPQCHWHIVIGSDVYFHFDQWKNAKSLLTKASLWVIERTSKPEEKKRYPLSPLLSLFPSHALHWDTGQKQVFQQNSKKNRVKELVRFLDFPISSVSSSAIRMHEAGVEWIPEPARSRYLSIISKKSRLL